MAKCTAVRLDGTACKANAKGNTPWCRWHDPSDEARAAHRAQSALGGFVKAHGAGGMMPTAEPLSADPDVSNLDLGTPHGLRGLLSALLRSLTHLPVDVRLANSIGNLATAQRGNIEQADIVARIEALEASAVRPAPRAPVEEAVR